MRNSSRAGTLAHRRLAGTEPGEPPLVLEFVKDVFRIAPLPVEFHDPEGVGLGGRQAGDAGGEILPESLPEDPLRTGADGLERAPDHHPARAVPAVELEFQLGELYGSPAGAVVPIVPRDGGDGAFDIGGELEFEEKRRAIDVVFLVPGHDGFMAEANVTAVEPDALPGNGAAPDFFHDPGHRLVILEPPAMGETPTPDQTVS